MSFKKLWKILQITPEDYFIKSEGKLTEEEVKQIHKVIYEMQARGLSADRIIKYLQNHNEKLAERWKAERAYYTEAKRIDTKEVKESGEILDLTKYRVLLSPHACPICRKKTDDGRKIFTPADLKKTGYGHYPPFHPNCYCTLIPQ